MLTLTATVQNPAQIVPCQCEEKLSVTRVQSVPKLQNTDNWHICHLPPKCLAHAEKFTRSAGGPSSVLLGQWVGGEGREKEPQYRGCGTIHFCPRDRAIKSLLQWLWNSLAPRWFLSEPHSWGHKAPPATNPAQQKKSLYNQSGQKVVCALPTLCPHCDEQPYAGSTCISLFCLLFPQSLHWAKRKQPESLPKVVYTVQAFTPWGNSIYLLRAWDQMG